MNALSELHLGRTPEELERFFAATGPWHTRFDIDGRSYGGTFPCGDDGRVETFFNWVGEPRSVIELGSLEGGVSLRLARYPSVERLVCAEVREANVRRARAVIELFGLDERVQVEQVDLEDELLGRFGRVDAAFCAGVLYHLGQPWEHLQDLSRITDTVFLDTHYAATGHISLNGYRGWLYSEHGLDDPASGVLDYSFWPTRDELERMVADAGFAITRCIDHTGHPNGGRLWALLERPA
jgi:hypothetical protein